MKLNRSKSVCLTIALFGPALGTLAYLIATEFPQRPDGPALPLRACGTGDDDLLAALIALFVGLVFLGLATRRWPIALFVLLAFAYTLLHFFFVSWVTMAWCWLVQSSAHERLNGFFHPR